MDKEEKEKWLLAGKIGKEVRQYAVSLAVPGESLLDIARKTDEKIREYGAKPAFPINISINNIAAHDHPNIDDERKLKEGDIVKIDLGASIDGYLSDTAETVVVGGGSNKLVEASRDALNAVIGIIKPEMEIDVISETIEKTVRSYGFSPIVNLGGHGIKRFDLHAHDFIPNVNQHTGKRLIKEGVIAVEPFVTNGEGYVIDSSEVKILMLQKEKPVRDPSARKVLEYVKSEYNTLPFARRWIEERFGAMSNYAIKSLVSAGVLYEFHVLKEASGGLVTQFEHTFLFDEGKVIVTTY